MPALSERKLAANRANAARSTGPRTAEGKARSRLNALGHGLRAETLVLPTEDPAEFEALRAGFFEDWKPPTETRCALVDRLAAGAWRLRRCVRAERDRLGTRMAEAVAEYDARVEARVAGALRVFAADPRRGLAELRAEHAGVEALAAMWDDLGRALSGPVGWTEPERHVRLVNLLGLDADTHPDDLGAAGLASLRLLLHRRPDLGTCPDPIADDREAAATAGALAAFVAAHASGVRGELAGYPDPDLVRSRVADSAAFDPSREAETLRRYEAQLDRSFRANLQQVVAMTKSNADLADPDEPTEPAAPNEPTALAPNEPTAPRPTPAAPNEPTDPAPPAPSSWVEPAPAADLEPLITSRH